MKKIIRGIKYITCFVLLFLTIAIVCSYIPISADTHSCNETKTIYLSTNGTHLDIILASEDIPLLFQQQLPIATKDNYLAIGWGEKDFYLNVKEWGDLTFSAAFKASLGLNESLLHLISYRYIKDDWVKVNLCKHQLEELHNYIAESLYFNEKEETIAYEGYGLRDVFYTANGRYTCVNTCNTWVNTAFKEVGLKASIWTPFDFGVLHYYE